MFNKYASRFFLIPSEIFGVIAVVRRSMRDARGSLTRIFCAEELSAVGWQGTSVQINHSHTRVTGTVRGMHYQSPPHSEFKLVTCLRGRVWDVAVDLRAGSPTFLSWTGRELSPENQTSLLIPPGCAHGFQTLSDDVELIYAVSTPYVLEAGCTLHPEDPSLGISWPLPVQNLSPKDSQQPWIEQTFKGVYL